MPSDARLLLLDKHHVERLLVPDDVLEAVREAFELHGENKGRNFPLVREKLNTGGIFGIKSGDVPEQHLLGFKAAGFWPRNREVGGEPHQATIMLFDPATGRPLCLIDGNAITTMRTGAAGGLGLLMLAARNCTDLCVFGTGVQATVQLRFALQLLPSLHTIRYVTSSGQRDCDFESRFAGRCDMLHEVDGNRAVSASTIIVTATPGKGPLFDVGALRPGTHVNCVGADTRGKRELPEGLLPRARLFVDDHEQARTIGEMQWAPEATYVELGQLVTGRARFERQPDDITVFDMTGLSLQDLAVARMVHRGALAGRIGLEIAWPW